MGRFFGRRPDPTPAVARALRRRFLDPGEEVLAGVYVQSPGTNSAAMRGGASAGISSAVGVHGAQFTSGGADARWDEEVARLHGVDAGVARRSTFLTVALTGSRLLLVRRSRVTRRHPRELFASWPLDEVDYVKVPRGGSTMRIGRAGAELRLELPLDLKFLDGVYTALPARFEQVTGPRLVVQQL